MDKDKIIENLKKENELLKEEIKELREGIEGLYNNLTALDIINSKELEDIGVI